MKTWIIHDTDNKIVNLIVAETKEIAEEITGHSALEYDLSVDLVNLDWVWNGEKFVDPSTLEE
jgi:hypothetical protein